MDSYVVTATFVVTAPSADVARMFVGCDVSSVVEADKAMPVNPDEYLFGGCTYRSGTVIDAEPTPVNHTLYLPFDQQAD